VTKRLQILFGVTVIICLALFGAAMIDAPLRQKVFGPKYGDIPLSAWQKFIREDTTPATFEKVHVAFFDEPDSGRWDLLPDEDRRAILLSLKDDPSGDVRKRVAEGLVELPKSAELIEPMRTLLGDSEGWVRSRAVAFFCDYRPPLVHMVPDLLKLLDDPDELVRSLAVDALGIIGAHAPLAVLPEVIRTVEAANVEARVGALAVLTRMESAARSAAPTMLKALESEAAEVRAAAVRALSRTGDKSVAPQIVRALIDLDEEVQEAALLALARIGADGKSAIPILIERLKRVDPAKWTTYERELTALGRMGSSACEAVPVLLTLRKIPGETERLRRHVGRTLNRIDPDRFPLTDHK
jgi:HEAT repeat protein